MNDLPYLPQPTLHAKTAYDEAIAALHEIAEKAPKGVVNVKSAA